MEYDFIIVDNSVSEIREIVEAKSKIITNNNRSFDIPEIGLRWVCGDEFCTLVPRVYERYKNYNSCNHIVLLVIAPKQWLITKIKYGI